jgi:hypothetical protein
MSVQMLTKEAGDELFELDEEELEFLLGVRVKAIEEDPQIQGFFQPDVSYADRFGDKNSLRRIGKRMVDKLHMQAYTFVCGTDPDDEQSRQEILDALKISSGAAVAALAAVLVSGLGLAAAVAGVVAALIIKKFIKPTLDAGYEAMCTEWKKYLPESGE